MNCLINLFSDDIQPAFIKEGLHSSNGLNEYIKFGKIILHEISGKHKLMTFFFNLFFQYFVKCHIL